LQSLLIELLVLIFVSLSSYSMSPWNGFCSLTQKEEKLEGFKTNRRNVPCN